MHDAPVQSGQDAWQLVPALMLALGALGPWLPLLRDPGFEPIIEKIVGVDRAQFLDRLAELQTFVLDIGEEALSLA